MVMTDISNNLITEIPEHSILCRNCSGYLCRRSPQFRAIVLFCGLLALFLFCFICLFCVSVGGGGGGGGGMCVCLWLCVPLSCYTYPW